MEGHARRKHLESISIRSGSDRVSFSFFNDLKAFLNPQGYLIRLLPLAQTKRAETFDIFFIINLHRKAIMGMLKCGDVFYVSVCVLGLGYFSMICYTIFTLLLLFYFSLFYMVCEKRKIIH